MIVQVNTGNHIDGSERMDDYVTEQTRNQLSHYVDKITRTEVHFADVNADKSGPRDIQCKVEVRLKGQEPLLGESKCDNPDDALNEALNKVQSALRTVVGKMQEKHPQRHL